MLKRTLIVLVSLVFALLCTAAGHIAYASITVTWLDRIHFFNYDYPLAHLLCAVVVLAVAILIVFRVRGIATLLFLAGGTGFLGATLHDCFICWGISYHWFQFGGTDGWVFRGFFETQENRALLFVAHTFQAMLLLVYVGIFLMAAQFARTHLTNRWS